MKTQPSTPQPVSELELAALAAAAAPRMQIREIRGRIQQTDAGQWLRVVDASGTQWLAWAPSFVFTADSAERYTTVVDLLAAASRRGQLGWMAPGPIGTVQRQHRGDVLVLQYPSGSPLRNADLSGSGLLPSSVGSALAALHQLDVQEYARACRRYADANITRSALRSLVDRHAASLPSRLQRRWMDAIDEDSLWGFDPVPLHGSLSADCVYSSNGAVVGITRFDQAAVGDPAQDMVWLMYFASDPFLQAFEEAYAMGRSAGDLHVLTRAQLLSELETLRWYSRGVAAGDSAWRLQGLSALRDLDADIGDQRLVPHRRDVVEITFTAAEEPLLRLQPNGTTGQASGTSPDEATEAVGMLDDATGLYDPFIDQQDETPTGSKEVP